MRPIHALHLGRQAEPKCCKPAASVLHPEERTIMPKSARLWYEFVTVDTVRPLWQLMNEPHLREYQDIPRLSLEQFRDRVRMRARIFARGTIGRHEWLLRTTPLGDPIGWVSVRTSRDNPSSGELGYTIARAHRRQGYATEAVATLIDGTFVAGILDKFVAYCLPENAGSRGVLDQLGLVEMRTVRRGAVVRGRPVDILLYEIDRISWRRKRSP
jgi:ribosomal-protein-alanine N-acetyltransferase